jgi:hypothetical protein
MQVVTITTQTRWGLLAAGPDMANVLAAVARLFGLNVSRFYVSCKGNKEQMKGFDVGLSIGLFFNWSTASR